MPPKNSRTASAARVPLKRRRTEGALGAHCACVYVISSLGRIDDESRPITHFPIRHSFSDLKNVGWNDRYTRLALHLRHGSPINTTGSRTASWQYMARMQRGSQQAIRDPTIPFRGEKRGAWRVSTEQRSTEAKKQKKYRKAKKKAKKQKTEC